MQYTWKTKKYRWNFEWICNTNLLTVIILVGNKCIMRNEACAPTWSVQCYPFDLDMSNAFTSVWPLCRSCFCLIHSKSRTLNNLMNHDPIIMVLWYAGNWLIPKCFGPGKTAQIAQADLSRSILSEDALSPLSTENGPFICGSIRINPFPNDKF